MKNNLFFEQWKKNENIFLLFLKNWFLKTQKKKKKKKKNTPFPKQIFCVFYFQDQKTILKNMNQVLSLGFLINISFLKLFNDDWIKWF